MKMKMRDVFEVEGAIVGRTLENGTVLPGAIKTKHWQLLKLLDKNLKKCREHTDAARKALEPSEAAKAYLQEQERVQAESANETREVQSAKIMDLKSKHPEAVQEILGHKKIEVEILEDAVEVEWVPIPEALLHDGGMCRVEGDSYMVLSRYGVVQE